MPTTASFDCRINPLFLALISVSCESEHDSFFLSLYTARPSFEFYRQVYFEHSGLQDESLQVTISKLVLGHFGHGHFGLGRFGLDISATDVSATENAKGGRFGHNHKWVWDVCMHKCVMHFIIF